MPRRARAGASSWGSIRLILVVTQFVMAGLVPAIHVFFLFDAVKTWMPGSSPGMTAIINHAYLNYDRHIMHCDQPQWRLRMPEWLLGARSPDGAPRRHLLSRSIERVIR